MKKKKVISRNNLPTRFPTLTPVLTVILALDYWNAEQWMWWVAIGIMVLMYSATLTIMVSKEIEVDFFEDEMSNEVKKSFIEKIAERQNAKKGNIDLGNPSQLAERLHRKFNSSSYDVVDELIERDRQWINKLAKDDPGSWTASDIDKSICMFLEVKTLLRSKR